MRDGQAGLGHPPWQGGGGVAKAGSARGMPRRIYVGFIGFMWCRVKGLGMPCSQSLDVVLGKATGNGPQNDIGKYLDTHVPPPR